MPIRFKLLLGFFAVTVMAGFLGAFGVHSVGVMGALAIETHDRPLMAINFARAAETDFVRARMLMAPLAEADGGAFGLPDEDEITDLLETFTDNLDVAAERALSEESRALAGKLLSLAEDWTATLEPLFAGGAFDAAAHAVAAEAIEAGIGDLVEMTAAEGFEFRLSAERLVERQRWIMLGALLATVLVAMALALFLAQRIVTPLKRVIGVIEALSAGDTSVEVDSASKDEVGQLARSVRVFRENMIEIERMREARRGEEKERQEMVRREMLALADTLDREVQVQVGDMDGEIAQLNRLIIEMKDAAAEVRGQSVAASGAADHATANVQTVASAAEEMSSTSDEISRQVEQSTEIAARAVQDAEETNTTIRGLAEATSRIGSVVGLISDIAEQTNLLALNATIEAARAGEAGKGFAVVAGEVKNLATQTAKATEEITLQIQNIQGVTDEAVTAIAQIGETNRSINDIAGSVASAIGELRLAIREVAESVQKAAQNVQEASHSISSVSQSSGDSERKAGDSAARADSVVAKSKALQQTLISIVRNSTAGNRRAHQRQAAQLSGRVCIDSQWVDCEILDISYGGVRLAPNNRMHVGQALQLEIEGLGPIGAIVVRLDEQYSGLRLDPEAEQAESLKALIDQMDAAA